MMRRFVGLVLVALLAGLIAYQMLRPRSASQDARTASGKIQVVDGGGVLNQQALDPAQMEDAPRTIVPDYVGPPIMYGRLSAQPRDELWAQTRENAMYRAFASLTRGVGVHAECRTDVCAVTGGFDAVGAAAEANMKQIQATASQLSERGEDFRSGATVSFSGDPAKSGRVVYALYLNRRVK